MLLTNCEFTSQLEDGHSLFDYNVGLNAIIQVIFKAEETVNNSVEEKKLDNETPYVSNDEDTVDDQAEVS